MSQSNNRIFDDFARLMTNAAGAAQGVRHEVDTLFKTQAERVLRDLDVVPREEFDAVREMAAKARTENDLLAKRIADLEASFSGLSAKAPAKPKTKAPAKKAKAPAKKTAKSKGAA